MKGEPSIRERIKAFQAEIRDDHVTPELARTALMKLTALLGNVNQEQREADMLYKAVLLKALKTDETANRAKITAETSAEYLRAREAKDTRDLVVEMIRSCKVYLRSLDEEMRLAR